MLRPWLVGVWILTVLNQAQGDRWDQWRGANRDGISQSTGLLKKWPENGPPLVWRVNGIGNGYSSMAISRGQIFTIGSLDGEESLFALDLKSGTPKWRLTFGDGRHSNGTPTIDGNRIYAIGLRGDLVCANAKTGKQIWRKNLKSDLDGKMMSGWGFSESPLIDGDHLICTPGGKDSAVVALDKMTGNEIWRSKARKLGALGADGAGYSSVVVSHAGGVKQYIQLCGRGIISVSASDGKLLWSYNAIANGTANIPTPIAYDNFVFCSTGYGTGAALLRISHNNNDWDVEEVYFLKSKRFQNHHGGMIKLGDFLFAGHGHNKGMPICLEISTGKTKWGGDFRGPGQGSAAICYADENLIFRYQDGLVALIAADSEKYELRGSFQPVFQQGNSWAHPVVFEGKLYLREQDELMCYDLRKL